MESKKHSHAAHKGNKKDEKDSKHKKGKKDTKEKKIAKNETNDARASKRQRRAETSLEPWLLPVANAAAPRPLQNPPPGPPQTDVGPAQPRDLARAQKHNGEFRAGVLGT